MVKRTEHSVLHYLRSIDAKLDQLVAGLATLEAAVRSARKSKLRLGEEAPLVVGTPEEAAEYRKNHPSDKRVIVVTGVPRAKRRP